MQDIMKTIKSPQESGILVKWISEIIKNKRKKGVFLLIILGTLATGLLESALTRKRVIKADERVIRTGGKLQCCPILICRLFN